MATEPTNTTADTKQESTERVLVSRDDHLELERRRLVEQVSKGVEADLRWKYFWVGLIVALGTGGFITLTVRNVFSSATNKLAVAEGLQSSASERLTKAAQESEKSLARANEAAERLEDVARQTETLSARVAETAKTNLEISQTLRDEVERLGQIVQEVASRQERSDAERERLVGDFSRFRTALGRSSEQIATAIKRADRSKYRINITIPHSGEMDSMADRLEREGFAVRRYPGSPQFEMRAIILFLPSDWPISVLRTIFRICCEPQLPVDLRVDAPGCSIGYTESSHGALTTEQVRMLLNMDTPDDEFWRLARVFVLTHTFSSAP